MLGLLGHFADKLDRARHDPGRDIVARRSVEPVDPQVLHFAGDDLGHSRLQRVIVQHRSQLPKDRFEKALMAIFVGQRGQQVTCDAGGVDLLELSEHSRSKEGPHPLVIEHTERVVEGGTCMLGEVLCMARISQEVRESARGTEVPDLHQHLWRTQEVGADERRKVRTDAILAAWDDGSVRDRQTQRMAEQRDDCKPVSNGADHCGFTERCDIAPSFVAVSQRVGDQIQRTGCYEQTDSYPSHSLQVDSSHDLRRCRWELARR